MKKTTRINTEMRYINNQQHFTITELMREFGISRSTAARDLADIQELGMPLISQVGPAGGYTVMRNQLLPAVQFNTDELKAPFVSFLATTNEQLPFLQNRQTMTQKLLAIASPAQQADLTRLRTLLRFENTNPANDDLLELTDLASPMLMQLINACLINRHLKLTLTTSDAVDAYVQYLYHEATRWEVVFFELTTQQTRTADLALVQAVQVATTTLNEQELQAQIQQASQKANLIIELGPHAIQQFKRLHRPDRVLHYLDPFEQRARYQDDLDLTDTVALNATIDWLLFLGADVQPIQVPALILAQIRARLTRW